MIKTTFHDQGRRGLNGSHQPGDYRTFPPTRQKVPTDRDGYSDVFAELIPEIKFPNLSISSRISIFFDQIWAENEEK